MEGNQTAGAGRPGREKKRPFLLGMIPSLSYGAGMMATTLSMEELRLDPAAVRSAFPILGTEVRGKPLVYLDNAATTQKPQAVIDAVSRFYLRDNANIHRGVHYLSEQATDAYDAARARVARFLHATDPAEVVFVRGATEAINLVASGFRETVLKPGVAVVITEMEHHANIVPWQLACERAGAELRVIPMDDRGVLDLEAAARLIDGSVEMVAVVHLSNALGTVNPVAELISMARAAGSAVLVDGAQTAPHFPVDVQALDADFFVFSGHKVYAPTGVGVLYGKRDRLAALPPYQGGGDMIRKVSFEGTTYREPPERFEAGTPHIAGAIGLAAALDFVESLGLEAICAHESALVAAAVEGLREIGGINLIGDAPERAGVVSFTLKGVHPHDIGTFLDADGIAIRAGHHCAQPAMRHFGLAGTARASFACYNTFEEVDALLAGIRKIKQFFGS